MSSLNNEITDTHAIDIITYMFKINEDWGDISLTEIENIIQLTGRNTDPYIICEECGDCFEQEQVEIKENINNFICAQCTEWNNNNE